MDLKRIVFSRILIFWDTLPEDECNNQVLTLLMACPDGHKKHVNLLGIYIYICAW